jgi:Effector-associated domain 1/TIR domain
MTPAECEELKQALMSAFPTPGELQQVVAFKLGKNLSVIAEGNSYSEIVFNLIQWTRAHEKMDSLLIGARQMNPGNSRLRVFEKQYRVLRGGRNSWLGDVHYSSPVKIFVGYSRKDRSYLEELRVHLVPYVRANKVACWDDTEINPGAMWREEIKTALQVANMAVLLVSAHFLASDFIVNHELPYLLASARSGKMVILSVIVRPSLFKDTDLAQFQAINSSSQPLSGMSRSERDKVWIRVVERIKANL